MRLISDKGQTCLRIITPKVNSCLRSQLPYLQTARCLDLALQVACGLLYLHSLSPPLLHLSLNRCALFKKGRLVNVCPVL